MARTAEEVAEEILTKASMSDPFLKRARMPILVNALTAYAEERVKEAEERALAKTYSQAFTDVRREACAEALEEAARVAQTQAKLTHGDCEYNNGWHRCAEIIEREIRALKDKP